MSPQFPLSTSPGLLPARVLTSIQPPLQISAAQPQHLQGLATILTDSFHPTLRSLSWFYALLRAGIYEDLRHRLRHASPYDICLIALDLDPSSSTLPMPLMGTVELGVRSLAPPWQIRPAVPYLSNLAVDAAFRGRGIAKQLLLACEGIVLAWEFQDLYLHVLENNYPARRLYEQMGYQLQQVDGYWGVRLWRQPRRLLLHKPLNGAATFPGVLELPSC
ncbi:GNAT family N-acetyltransferase [Neosynechococcus sphagnicola]|uniref:GNAT family N-acetyltransferase n=1 Tax=Neosynechococcus sphagnicola TaxID=1501145 RepID=UPI00068DA00C|nr:GNAT family N-acetyltransferase [Neosynechococcus sphagnicola]